jgi:hypothetical protein
LLESPFIKERITANWVRKTGYVKNDFTDRECQVVADLANILRPYIPKRQSSTRGALTHVSLRAPLALIANAVLRAAGYSLFAREFSPSVSPSSLYGLTFGARGIYEVFCSRKSNQFSITGSNGKAITSTTSAARNKRMAIGAFFDLANIDEICKRHGLRFASR